MRAGLWVCGGEDLAAVRMDDKVALSAMLGASVALRFPDLMHQPAQRWLAFWWERLSGSLALGVAPDTPDPRVLLYWGRAENGGGHGSDFASITKIFGVAVHQRHGTVDWLIVRRLAWQRLPAAAATLFWMSQSAVHQVRDGICHSRRWVGDRHRSGMLLEKPLQRQGFQPVVQQERHNGTWQPRLTVPPA